MEGEGVMWATAETVLSRWIGSGAPNASSSTLTTLIEDTEDEILRIFPAIQARIDSNELPLSRVQRVISQVVQRAYRLSGEYRTSFSEATGPFSHSGTYDSSTPRTVSLTEEEKAVLRPAQKPGNRYSLSMLSSGYSGFGLHDDMELGGYREEWI